MRADTCPSPGREPPPPPPARGHPPAGRGRTKPRWLLRDAGAARSVSMNTPARSSLAAYNFAVPRHSASNPLTERYASKEMSYLFSPDYKFRTWRRLWIALAEAEKELGLPITDAQIAELRANSESINYEDAERRGREIRHDVRSHTCACGLP